MKRVLNIFLSVLFLTDISLAHGAKLNLMSPIEGKQVKVQKEQDTLALGKEKVNIYVEQYTAKSSVNFVGKGYISGNNVNIDADIFKTKVENSYSIKRLHNGDTAEKVIETLFMSAHMSGYGYAIHLANSLFATTLGVIGTAIDLYLLLTDVLTHRYYYSEVLYSKLNPEKVTALVTNANKQFTEFEILPLTNKVALEKKVTEAIAPYTQGEAYYSRCVSKICFLIGCVCLIHEKNYNTYQYDIFYDKNVDK